MCVVVLTPSVGFIPEAPCSAWWPGDTRPWWRYASAWGGDALFPRRRRRLRDPDDDADDTRDAMRQREHDAHDREVKESREFMYEP